MFLSDKQVAERYGVSRGTPWRWASTSTSFPRPVELSPGCTRWNLGALEAWETLKTDERAVSNGQPDDLRPTNLSHGRPTPTGGRHAR